MYLVHVNSEVATGYVCTVYIVQVYIVPHCRRLMLVCTYIIVLFCSYVNTSSATVLSSKVSISFIVVSSSSKSIG